MKFYQNISSTKIFFQTKKKSESTFIYSNYLSVHCEGLNQFIIEQFLIIFVYREICKTIKPTNLQRQRNANIAHCLLHY